MIMILNIINDQFVCSGYILYNIILPDTVDRQTFFFTQDCYKLFQLRNCVWYNYIIV